MRLFISYAHVDKEAVRALVEVLRDGGNDPWFDPRLVVAKEWKQQLLDAIIDCDALVFCMSPRAVASEWCLWELSNAIQHGKAIIPVMLVEGTTIPASLKPIQYVDFSKGANATNTARLMQGLNSIAVTLPAEAAPAVPANPSGVPAQAVRRNIPIAMGLALLTMIALMLFFLVLPQTERNNLLNRVGLVAASPTATYTPSPIPMQSGFNVIVAGFTEVQADNTVRPSPAAESISDTIYAELKGLQGIDNLRGRLDFGVGHVLGRDAAERRTAARDLAERLRASVVIYGTVKLSADGIYTTFSPEFYVSAAFASAEPDLIEGDQFGQSVEYLTGATDLERQATAPVQKRLSTMRYFLTGLAFYISGDFSDASVKFNEAIDVDSSVEVLYIFAGNAANRSNDPAGALAFYNSALSIRSTYARALVGKAQALFVLARSERRGGKYDTEGRSGRACAQVTIPPETWHEKITLALRCLEDATNSADELGVSDVDVKIAFDYGQIYTWLSRDVNADLWSAAREQLEKAITLYDSSDPVRQARIRQRVAQAYAGLGVITHWGQTHTVVSIDMTIGYYNKAIALLEQDVNRAYNNSFIVDYRREIEHLKQLREDPALKVTSSTVATVDPMQ